MPKKKKEEERPASAPKLDLLIRKSVNQLKFSPEPGVKIRLHDITFFYFLNQLLMASSYLGTISAYIGKQSHEYGWLI